MITQKFYDSNKNAIFGEITTKVGLIDKELANLRKAKNIGEFNTSLMLIKSKSKELNEYLVKLMGG